MTIYLSAAIAHLDKAKVWGKNIRVTQSKHSLVQMPKDGQPVSRHNHTILKLVDTIVFCAKIEPRSLLNIVIKILTNNLVI